jgi:hypothetical protein
MGFLLVDTEEYWQEWVSFSISSAVFKEGCRKIFIKKKMYNASGCPLNDVVEKWVNVP